jgi:drug/metabolite transporter (DMT)-like permease
VTLSLEWTLLVLLAALMHAGWNVLVKFGDDALVNMTLIMGMAGLIALAFVPFVSFPDPESWIFLAGSLLTHIGYYVFLLFGYRYGDLSLVYPIARGSAPLMTATATALFIGERLGLLGWCGIILLVAGVLLLSLRGGRELAQLDRRAVGFALFTAVTICAYSVVDGVGARLAVSANAYSIALFLGIAPVMLIYALVRRGHAVIPAMGRNWGLGLAGGALQLGSYGIAIWAMTLAPIAIVAALRETSVLFGAAIAVIFLKEPLRASRIGAALMIVAGLVLIRLQ